MMDEISSNTEWSPLTSPAAPIESRVPKLSVFLILAAMHLFGIGCGFRVWYHLNQGGKDPLAELYRYGPIGVAIAAALYALYFRRTWRVTIPAIVVAFALGALTGLAAVVLHIQKVGWL